MPIWMMAAGLAFVGLLIYLGSKEQEADTPGEKKAWNFVLGAILVGGTIMLAFV